MVLGEGSFIKYHLFNGTGLMVFDGLFVILGSLECQLFNLHGHIVFVEIEYFCPTGTVVLQVDLTPRKNVFSRRILKQVNVFAIDDLLAESVDILAATDRSVRHPQLIITTHICIIGSGQRNMMGCACLIGMNDEIIAHWHFLDGIQDDMLFLLINTY